MAYLQRWHDWCYVKLLLSRRVLCTPYNHALCQFLQSHICKVHACLTVTCHLHFGQNDRDLLHATVVTQGRNRYRNKSQHRKSTLEKNILLPLLRESIPWPFNHESSALTTELSLLPWVRWVRFHMVCELKGTRGVTSIFIKSLTNE